MAVDPTIFRHTELGVIIGVHVDDFMITGGMRWLLKMSRKS